MSENLDITFSFKIWMFASRYLNDALSNIHKQTLRLIYDDSKLSFDKILEKREENIKPLAT